MKSILKAIAAAAGVIALCPMAVLVVNFARAMRQAPEEPRHVLRLREWHDVKRHGMPKEKGSYQITAYTPYAQRFVEQAFWLEGKWYRDGVKLAPDWEVVAWRALPSPYRGDLEQRGGA